MGMPGFFGGMVMRAASAVLVRVPGFFGSMVMRAAFAVLVVVPGFFGSMVMRAALTMFMMMVFLRRGICRISSRIGNSGDKS
jgi:hypothetical protein